MNEFNRGDVFFMNLEGPDHVQCGWRPYIILQNDLGNRYSPTTIVAPLTSHLKRLDMKTHVVLTTGPFYFQRSMVLLEQIRTINVDLENWRYMGHIPARDMKAINEAIKISLGVE